MCNKRCVCGRQEREPDGDPYVGDGMTTRAQIEYDRREGRDAGYDICRCDGPPHAYDPRWCPAR